MCILSPNWLRLELQQSKLHPVYLQDAFPIPTTFLRHSIFWIQETSADILNWSTFLEVKVFYITPQNGNWTFNDLLSIQEHRKISSRRNADKCVSFELGKENCWIDKFSWSGRSANAFPISGGSQAWHFLSVMPTLLSSPPQKAGGLIRLKTSIFEKHFYWK